MVDLRLFHLFYANIWLIPKRKVRCLKYNQTCCYTGTEYHVLYLLPQEEYCLTFLVTSRWHFHNLKYSFQQLKDLQPHSMYQ